MARTKNMRENGSAKGWTVAAIGSTVLLVGISILAGWLYAQYIDQKTNVDTKIESAVATEVKKQADSDELKFFERDKEPNREFVGPDDYGRVTFNYPKTWSVYIDKDATNGGSFEAFLNPISVPPIDSSQQFALRVVIEATGYNQVIDAYDSSVQEGSLKASSVTADGNIGARFDGSFSDDVRGSAVVFKIRDKTLTIRTDTATFTSDFDKLVQTIKFNQ